MPLIVSDIKLPVTAAESDLNRRIATQCGVDLRTIRSVRLVRRALDARKKNDIHFLLRAIVAFDDATERTLLARNDRRLSPYRADTPTPLAKGSAPLAAPIVVVGLGPAGLFCAHTLAQYGYRPIVVERGEPVEQRVQTVERYFSTGALHNESNVMFGEGGAGTFSDGKLTSRSKDARQEQVLNALVRFGAPADILIDAKPHIGTDRLRNVVGSMRQSIESLGGTVRFGCRLAGIESADGRVTAVRVDQNGAQERIPCAAVVLAIGQGARDTYQMLFDAGVSMVKKPFAVGVRIEHPQALIDTAQFGSLAGNPRLGAASYALTGKSGERGVYTFCMCPGGQVIASASGPDQVVVNGMSNHARDGVNANAAIVVQVHNDDTPPHPLAGMRFQAQLEQKAFLLGGQSGRAPAIRAYDFLHNQKPAPFGGVKPTYRPGVIGSDIRLCLPDFVWRGIQDGLTAFGRQLRGFDLPDAVLTAPETRTSAPVRIERNERMTSVSHDGLYPVGEGAGYAGGIVSAAIDGLRAAEQIIARFAAP